MVARRVIALVGLSACGFDPDRIDPTADDPTVDAATVVVHRDCLDALGNGVTTNGVLTIDPDGDGPNAPFDAYCDMTTEGGGWTLVWSYGFTDYANFNSGENAITPQPSWTPAGDVPMSMQVPLGPGMPGALDFARWIELGENFLVDSNINHVVACRAGGDGGGSIVALRAGGVSCSMVRSVAPACTTNVPTSFGNVQGAWGLMGPNTYYYWDPRATTTLNWPTHDPCGFNQVNQVKGVSSPYGAVFLRR